MLANIDKVHSTTMSLNERFTAIASKRIKPQKPNTNVSTVNQVASLANRKLLQELIRRDKIRAALKLKRRSMRTAGNVEGCSRAILRVNNGIPIKRGSVKALRIAANGYPIKANSMSRVATMNADLVSVRSRRRGSLRSNSIANRLGGLRQRRSVDATEIVNRSVGIQRLGRLRSRSRMRMSADQIGAARRRSRSRTRFSSVDGRNLRRGRSRTRRDIAPIQTRLGTRPRNTATVRSISGRRGDSQNRLRRRPSLMRVGVARGRVQKIRGGGRAGRPRGRALRGVSRSRSQSRNGRALGGKHQQQPKRVLQPNGSQPTMGRRGRSQQRGRNTPINGKQVANAGNQQELSQQRRGRSRSRGRKDRIGRNQGQNTKTQTLSKDDLDKELDQYMMTTKTQNNVDYLLKN